MIKKIVFGIINVFSVLIIIAAVFVLCTVIFTKSGEAPSVFGYTALRVTTGSMKPTYDVDTLIVVKKVDPETIKVNDVISFYSQDPVLDGAVNTHRVVEILEEEQGRVFVTKGSCFFNSYRKNFASGCKPADIYSDHIDSSCTYSN